MSLEETDLNRLILSKLIVFTNDDNANDIDNYRRRDRIEKTLHADSKVHETWTFVTKSWCQILRKSHIFSYVMRM